MKKSYKLFVFCFIFAMPFMVPEMTVAQSKARVENVDFFLEGENLVITYDIVKAKTGETFDVSVNISTVSGQKISAFSLSGDVGPGVYAGKYKKIVWNLKSDNVFIDDEILVEVLARSMSGASGVNVGGALLRSLVFPGWGNSYAADGGAYWVMGIAAWGATGAAVYFNHKASGAYDDYKASTDSEERDQFYSDAEDYHKMQKTMALTAAAVWAVDLIWTGIQASSVKKQQQAPKVSMGYYYDPWVNKPMFSLTYHLN